MLWGGQLLANLQVDEETAQEQAERISMRKQLTPPPARKATQKQPSTLELKHMGTSEMPGWATGSWVQRVAASSEASTSAAPGVEASAAAPEAAPAGAPAAAGGKHAHPHHGMLGHLKETIAHAASDLGHGIQHGIEQLRDEVAHEAAKVAHEAAKPEAHPFADFWIGAIVEHPKHGRGVVEHFLLVDGVDRVRIAFDNGSTHRYDSKSVKKLTLVDAGPDEQQDREMHTLSFFGVMLYAPSFILQALLLWLPLSIWPPLAKRLKNGGHEWYLLEVPCLKFYACFALDLCFFVSLTLLSQASGYAPDGHRQLIELYGLRGLVIMHICWCVGILIHEYTRFFSSKWAELADLKEGFVSLWMKEVSVTYVCNNSLTLLGTILRIDQLVDACDLFGPLLALIALVNWGLQLQLESDSRLAVPQPSILAFSLLLFGWRLLRVMMMISGMGPLILAVNSMIGDVMRWLLVQITLILGFTAALYALFGSPNESVRTIGDAYPYKGYPYVHVCETITLGSNQVSDGEYPTRTGPWNTLLLMLWHVTEMFLSTEADMACMRQHTDDPVSGSLLLMLFQIMSAILMINMLIAMMVQKLWLKSSALPLRNAP